nr:MAG TPA_asm: hypothetical protein [Caudoviricetes sp.]
MKDFSKKRFIPNYLNSIKTSTKWPPWRPRRELRLQSGDLTILP